MDVLSQNEAHEFNRVLVEGRGRCSPTEWAQTREVWHPFRPEPERAWTLVTKGGKSNPTPSSAKRVQAAQPDRRAAPPKAGTTHPGKLSPPQTPRPPVPPDPGKLAVQAAQPDRCAAPPKAGTTHRGKTSSLQTPRPPVPTDLGKLAFAKPGIPTARSMQLPPGPGKPHGDILFRAAE